MRPGTLARLAIAGNRSDILRFVLTTCSAGLAAVALLAAGTVISIHGYADRYTNALLIEPGLRPGVMIALVLVAFPVLALAGQCSRLGAPARDRRLAAIRLAGATPGEAVLIATAETAVASLVGSSMGLVAYLAGRQLIAQRDHAGRLALPTDVLPPTPAIMLVVLAVPLLAAAIGAVLMRRVIVTPLGVVRRTRERGPRPWPGLLIGAGLALFAVPFNWPDGWGLSIWAVYATLGTGSTLVMVGVVLGPGWISYATGRLMRRYGRTPSMLLAGQRLITDPWNGSRTLAALLITVVAGGVTLGLRETIVTEVRGYEIYNATFAEPRQVSYGLGADPDFYLNAYRLVMIVVGLSAVAAAAGMLVALAESIVTRRRTYAALTASGVPRSTLSASVLWQSLTPLVPALVLALGSGVSLVRVTGTEIPVGTIVMRVPIPFRELALLGGGALLAVFLAAGAGLLVLRSSTDLKELRV